MSFPVAHTTPIHLGTPRYYLRPSVETATTPLHSSLVSRYGGTVEETAPPLTSSKLSFGNRYVGPTETTGTPTIRRLVTVEYGITPMTATAPTIGMSYLFGEMPVAGNIAATTIPTSKRIVD